MKVKFLGMAEEDDNLKERIDNAGNIQRPFQVLCKR